MTTAGRRMTKGIPDFARASSARRLLARKACCDPAPSTRAEICTISPIRAAEAASYNASIASAARR